LAVGLSEQLIWKSWDQYDGLNIYLFLLMKFVQFWYIK